MQINRCNNLYCRPVPIIFFLGGICHPQKSLPCRSLFSSPCDRVRSLFVVFQLFVLLCRRACFAGIRRKSDTRQRPTLETAVVACLLPFDPLLGGSGVWGSKPTIHIPAAAATAPPPGSSHGRRCSFCCRRWSSMYTAMYDTWRLRAGMV